MSPVQQQASETGQWQWRDHDGYRCIGVSVRVSDCGRRLMAAEVSIVWPSNLLFVQSAGVSCAEVSGSVDDMEESVKFFSA